MQNSTTNTTVSEEMPFHTGSVNFKDLLEKFQPTVKQIAYRYRHYYSDIKNLISEGEIGLLNAVESFDPARGTNFKSYACTQIRQKIYREAQCNNLIRIPMCLSVNIIKIRKARQELTKKLGRNPEIQEIADHMQVDVKTIQRINSSNFTEVSMHQQSGIDEDKTLEDSIPDRNAELPGEMMDKFEFGSKIGGFLATLDTVERQVIVLRYGLGEEGKKTLGEVSMIVGKSKERVRQIEEKVIEKLKTTLG